MTRKHDHDRRDHDRRSTRRSVRANKRAWLNGDL